MRKARHRSRLQTGVLTVRDGYSAVWPSDLWTMLFSFRDCMDWLNSRDGLSNRSVHAGARVNKSSGQRSTSAKRKKYIQVHAHLQVRIHVDSRLTTHPPYSSLLLPTRPCSRSTKRFKISIVISMHLERKTKIDRRRAIIIVSIRVIKVAVFIPMCRCVRSSLMVDHFPKFLGGWYEDVLSFRSFRRLFYSVDRQPLSHLKTRFFIPESQVQ